MELRRIAGIALLLLSTSAQAQQTQSTINPNVPVPGTLVEQSGPLFRTNWQAAINDINVLFANSTAIFSSQNAWTNLQLYNRITINTTLDPGVGAAFIAGNVGTVVSNPGANNVYLGSTIFSGNTASINSMAPGFLSGGVSGITVGAPSGAVGGLFGAECSHNVGGGYLKCGPVVQTFVYADTTRTNNTGIGGIYMAGQLLATSDPVAVGGGRVYGYVSTEESVQNQWGFVASDPYNANPNGGVHGHRVDCGFGVGGTNNCGGGAFELVLNPTQTWNMGLMCGHNSLVSNTVLGTAGLGQCVAMDDGHGIMWFSAAGTYAASITEKINTNAFLNLNVATSGGIQFQVNGATQLAIESTVMFPQNNNALSLGGTSLRFANIFSVLGNFSGGVTASGLPASAGGGGLFVCVDSVGVFYKKATCP